MQSSVLLILEIPSTENSLSLLPLPAACASDATCLPSVHACLCTLLVRIECCQTGKTNIDLTITAVCDSKLGTLK